jgi:magnesium transporter
MTKSKKVGLSPGTLVFTGKQKIEKHSVKFIRYNAELFEELEESQIFSYKLDGNFIYWIDIKGIHDNEFISRVGEKFGIHRLILEDIMDPSQRTKVEDYEAGIYVSFKTFAYDKMIRELLSEQISLFYNENYVISFQENDDDTFKQLRDRMQGGHSRIRSKNTDYLLYSIIDFIVDHYFLVLDQIDIELNILEEMADHKKSKETYHHLFQIKRNLLLLRRSVAPLREEVQLLRKIENERIEESTFIYLRDLEDHVAHIIETLDNQRELLFGIKDLMLQKANLDMNRDMKWLAVVSTLSIPIVFFTGVYGMNFEHMPELKWPWAYYFWWGAIISILLLLVWFFKKKNLL